MVSEGKVGLTPISGKQQKAHWDSFNRDLSLVSDSKSLNASAESYIEGGLLNFDREFVVMEIPKDDVRFDASLRSALSKTAASIQAYFYKALEYHNEHIAGTKASEFSFWRMQDDEFNDLYNEGVELFQKSAAFLLNRLKQNDPYKSFQAFCLNVMTPLEEMTYRNDNPVKGLLQGIFEELLDPFAREVYSGLLAPHVSYSQDRYRPVCYKSASFIPSPEIDATIQSLAGIYLFNKYTGEKKAENAMMVEFLEAGTLPAVEVDNERNALLISDLLEMTPYFIKNWDCAKHELPVLHDLSFYIDIAFGFPCVYLSMAGATQSHQIKTHSTAFRWSIKGDFYWNFNTAIKNTNRDLVGAAVLELVHDRFLSLFAKVKFKSASEVQELSVESSDFVSATHHAFKRINDRAEDHDYAGDPIEPSAAGVIPSLRISRFLTFMQNEHECKVDKGKGSEIKIWRKGSRIFTIGRHKRNPTVPAWMIREILKRLGISQQDWLTSLDRL